MQQCGFAMTFSPQSEVKPPHRSFFIVVVCVCICILQPHRQQPSLQYIFPVFENTGYFLIISKTRLYPSSAHEDRESEVLQSECMFAVLHARPGLV